MFSIFDLGKNAERVTQGRNDIPYDGVIVTADSDETMTDEETGEIISVQFSCPMDTSGCQNILRVNCRYATQQIADDIYSLIEGYVYEQFEAGNALLDPAHEIGDGVTANGVYGIPNSKTVTFSALMAADLSATTDTELEHEYPYTVNHRLAEENAVKRLGTTFSVKATEILARIADDEGNMSQIQQTLSAVSLIVQGHTGDIASLDLSLQGLTSTVSSHTGAISTIEQNVESISSTVQDHTGSISTLSQNLTSISATVTSQGHTITYQGQTISEQGDEIDDLDTNKLDSTGGVASSFGWELKATGFSLKSNGSEVFKCNSSGIEVTGKITATSGSIGGCTIENGALTVDNAHIGTLSADKITSGTLNDGRLSSYASSGVSGGYSFASNALVDSSSVTFTSNILRCNFLNSTGNIQVGSGGTGTIFIYQNGVNRTCQVKKITDCQYCIGF